MQEPPLVSVIIRTHNRVALLVEAVASVQKQTYPHFEIIIADHGSTDDTAVYATHLTGPIHYLYVAEKGYQSIPLNRAVAIAQGDLIAILDDDDLWQPEKLAKQVGLLVNQPEVGFVYCDVCLLAANGEVSPPAMYAHQKQSGDIFNHLLAGCIIHPSTVLIRRDLLAAVGPFDETLPIDEDYDMWLRLAYRTAVGFIDEPLTLIRRHHSQQISSERSRLAFECTLTVLEKVKKEFPLSFRQKLRLRQTSARMQTHLGLLQLSQSVATARPYFWQSLRTNPWQRRAWVALAQSYIPRR